MPLVADPLGFVTLARVLRPHGRKGEVAAEILTDFPERLTSLREVYLRDGKSARRAVVRSCWLSQSRGGQAIFYFEGCDSISDAEKLRGLEVQVPLTERVALPAGRYYVTDLIGCKVFQREAEDAKETKEAKEKQPPPSCSSPASLASFASKLGRVRDVQFTGAAPLLAVETPHGELLIPLAEEICPRIDVAAQRIEVVLPDGLLDLNRK